MVPKFEKKLAKNVNAKYAAALNSATSALHVACMSIGLNKNDYLWTVPNTFIASANCGLYCGAKIDFVDIDYETGSISIEKLEKKIIKSKKRKKTSKNSYSCTLCWSPNSTRKNMEIIKNISI